MSESHNSQVSLYRLSLEKVNKKIFKDAREKNKQFVKIEDNEKFIEFIILSKKKPYDNFEELKLKDFDNSSNFSIKVFYDDIALNAKWVGFFQPMVDDSEVEFFKKMNVHKSFVAFIYNQNDIFVFCGGLGSHLVKDYTDDDFGISVIIRLLKKDEMELRRAINRSITGNELSSDRFFKANHKIGNEDFYGKIFKSIYSSIPKDVLWEKLGIPKREKDRAASVAARSYFQLGRAISYKELLTIVSNIADILKEEPLFELNKIKKISGRGIGEKEEIERLYNKLSLDIFVAFKDGNLARYDLLNKDLEKFVEGVSFTIKKGVKIFSPIEGIAEFNLQRIFHEISNENYFTEKISEIDLENIDPEKDLDDILILRSILEQYKIETQDSEGLPVTFGSILDHIQAELELDGAIYFYLEEEWYSAKQGFIDDVNVSCAELIEQLKVEDLLREKWDANDDTKKDEEAYIEKHFKDEYSEYIFPLHKALHNKVELCDLLIKKDRSLYFVHIKRGFDGSVRDLISQIYLSSKIFVSERAKSKSWEENALVDGYFKSLKSLDGESSYAKKFKAMYKNYKKQTFVNIFKEKIDNFYFVFAIVDEAKKQRLLPSDIIKFKSVIAKMSLINLERDIASVSTRSASLKFVQIQR